MSDLAFTIARWCATLLISEYAVLLCNFLLIKAQD